MMECTSCKSLAQWHKGTHSIPTIWRVSACKMRSAPHLSLWGGALRKGGTLGAER